MRRLRRAGLLAMALMLPGAACGGGGGTNGPTDGAVEISAKNLMFNTDEITLAAGAQATIRFENEDGGLPHNVAIYSDETAQDAIFQGDLVEGPDTIEYTFEAPEAGEYFFRCDVHPTQMTGTVVVE